MDKLLTISIAAYNVESTLEDALSPFCECENKDKLEVLIIDDGSKDETAEIGKEYERQHPDIFRVISKKNGGWGSTLNVGIQEGKGRYFKQLDGDDYFSSKNLDELIGLLSHIDADLVYTPFVTFEDRSKAILREVGVYENIPYETKIPLKELNDFVPAMHTLTVRMEVLKKNNINITEHCFYTDVEFVLKVCNLCQNVVFFELPIYYYRLARSGQSMSINGVRKHYKDHLKMLTQMLLYESKEVTRQEVKDIFTSRLSAACEMQYIFFFALECSGEQKNELINFDSFLKNNYFNYYNRIHNKAVIFLRKVDFHGYFIIGHLQTLRDKRRKINIFEEC